MPHPAVAARVAPVVTAAVAGLGLGYVALVDPHESGRYPVCPFRAATGLLCPFCGGLRATHDLLHGDVTAAFHDNALVLLLAATAIVVFAVGLLSTMRGGSPSRRSLATAARLILVRVRVRTSAGRVAIALGALCVAFAVIRNLPVGQTLTP